MTKPTIPSASWARHRPTAGARFPVAEPAASACSSRPASSGCACGVAIGDHDPRSARLAHQAGLFTGEAAASLRRLAAMRTSTRVMRAWPEPLLAFVLGAGSCSAAVRIEQAQVQLERCHCVGHVDDAPARQRSATTPTSTPAFITRLNVRQTVPPRQPAAAQLQVGADRLSRPQFISARLACLFVGRTEPPSGQR